MRRVVALALITGGTLVTITAAFALGLRRGLGPEAPGSSKEDLAFRLFAPGGPQGFWFNGPVGWAFAKVMPFGHAGVYDVVAELLDLRPEDELLDIGCGPGAFLAGKAGHIRRIVGLDPSRVMVHEAEKRLARRIAAGTARLVLDGSAKLPFDNGEFSVVTAITAPANLAEVFRVLRPGGRFVFVDELNVDPRKPSSERTDGVPGWDWNEVAFRRILEEAGFTDLTVRYKGIRFLADNRIVSCRKPAVVGSHPTVDVDGGHVPSGSIASV